MHKPKMNITVDSLINIDIKANNRKDGARNTTSRNLTDGLGNTCTTRPNVGPLQLGFLRRGL
jgi:hypothetical protein